MRTLDALPPEQLAAVSELTARLKHDLGKYIAFGARWLPADATLEARREALVDDLLRTRRGPDGVHDALRVWAPYRRALTGEAPLATGVRVDLTEEPLVQHIVLAMQGLAPVVQALRAGEPVEADGVQAALTTCREVSAACRDLHRRTHEATRHG